MGKGKGTFEYWMCRAPVGKVIFEIGGGGIAEQIAKDGGCMLSYFSESTLTTWVCFTALRLASAKLPVTTEFVTRASLPRVGSELVQQHSRPEATLLPSSDSPNSIEAAAA